MAKSIESIDLTTESPRPTRAFAAHVPPPAAEARSLASKRAASPAQPVAAKKAKPPTMGYALVLIPYTCKGGERLEVLGVHATRREAVEARRERLKHYEGLGQCYGRGDVCVGDDDADEMKLKVVQAPLFLS